MWSNCCGSEPSYLSDELCGSCLEHAEFDDEDEDETDMMQFSTMEIMVMFAKKEVEAINYTHCCTTFTCDVCYKETSNKKDNEGYRYCKSCKEL